MLCNGCGLDIMFRSVLTIGTRIEETDNVRIWDLSSGMGVKKR